jgi:gamma-glutamyltranspeptidase / glutathione hydrolase
MVGRVTPGMPMGLRRPLPNWPGSWGYERNSEPVRAGRALVSTTDGYATRVGVEVLRAGGNAVDAAVAVSFALAVVNPEAGNLGGSGYLLARMRDGTALGFDCRSTAPLAATADLFQGPGRDGADRSVLGHLAVAVPGSVLGLEVAHQRLGRLPWGRLVGPSIELARGFEVTARFLQSFTPDVVEGLRRFPASASIFLPGGEVPRLGDVFRQPDLAATLERIRDRGSHDFYHGETAARLVSEMEREGGILSRSDLASYRVRTKSPLRFSHCGHTVLSMPPSSSGGVTLAETARILEPHPLGAFPWHSAGHVHLLAEAWRRAYADRNEYLADPDFVEVPTAILTSAGYGAWRGRDISLERATPSGELPPGREGFGESEHTTHISIVDPDGNAVSLTTTVNTWYGSKVVAEGTGVLLNNDMDDFAARLGVPNYFGLLQGAGNAVGPGKRMLSAMSPAIVLGPGEGPEGETLLLVVGTPGGATIITTVFQVISNLLDHGMSLAQAVLAPRVHHQHLPDRIWYEPGGLPTSVVEELVSLGHEVVERDELSGDVQAILVRPDGTLEGQSDPRRGGVAAGF